MTRRWWLLAIGLLLIVPTGAAARPAGSDGGPALTAAEAAALAREAVTSDAALDQLREVDEVDDRPVDLASATESMGAARAARLEQLASQFEAGGTSGSELDADSARDDAASVLADDKFDEQQLPRPFKGVLEWLADLVRPVGRWFEPFGDAVAAIPGGPYLLAAALVAATAGIIWWLARRRSGAAVIGAGSWGVVDPAEDPEDLERRAEIARGERDHTAEVRLRYEAGLLRLDRAGRVRLRPETTAEMAARQIESPTMDDLTVTFEVVVYGGEPATAADGEASRNGWRAVLGEKVRS